MATRRPKRPKFEKLAINMERGLVIRYDSAYNAPEAARIATKAAKDGWRVTIQSWGSAYKRNILMTCGPASSVNKRSRSKLIASCTMTPAFKKRLTWKRK